MPAWSDPAQRHANDQTSATAEVTTRVEGYLVTPDGDRKLGSGEATSGPDRTPGVGVPAIVTVVTANPIGLIVTLPVEVAGEVTGKNTVEGVGEDKIETIAEALEDKFREQGWIGK